eukprot:COSAG01_NODE_1445_length_10281_cov_33.445099_10_plen_51_part_00
MSKSLCSADSLTFRPAAVLCWGLKGSMNLWKMRALMYPGAWRVPRCSMQR